MRLLFGTINPSKNIGKGRETNINLQIRKVKVIAYYFCAGNYCNCIGKSFMCIGDYT